MTSRGARSRGCSNAGPVEARGDAMLGVAFASGLRLSELVGLLADLNLETGELVVRGWFRPS